MMLSSVRTVEKSLQDMKMSSGEATCICFANDAERKDTYR